MKARFRGVLFALSFLMLPCCIDVAVQADAETQMADQQGALEAYQQLYSHFTVDERTLQAITPEEYGGEYLEGDKLVLLLTENTPENQQKYLEWCGGFEKVEFREVAYSLNYLERLNEKAELLAGEFNVVGYGADRKENCYRIQVKQSDYEAAKQFVGGKWGSDPIVLESSEGYTELASSSEPVSVLEKGTPENILFPVSIAAGAVIIVGILVGLGIRGWRKRRGKQ